jgi:hypothetical protein
VKKGGQGPLELRGHMAERGSDQQELGGSGAGPKGIQRFHGDN